jgi:hypothetical protein
MKINPILFHFMTHFPLPISPMLDLKHEDFFFFNNPLSSIFKMEFSEDTIITLPTEIPTIPMTIPNKSSILDLILSNHSEHFRRPSNYSLTTIELPKCPPPPSCAESFSETFPKAKMYSFLIALGTS